MGLDVIFRVPNLKPENITIQQYVADSCKFAELNLFYISEVTKDMLTSLPDYMIDIIMEYKAKLEKEPSKIEHYSIYEIPLFESIRINSKKYPEHLFKIGYFRSSYNEMGIESVLSKRELPRLHELLLPDLLDENQHLNENKLMEEPFIFLNRNGTVEEECTRIKNDTIDLIEKLKASLKDFTVISIRQMPANRNYLSLTEVQKIYDEHKNKIIQQSGRPVLNYSASAGDFFFGDPITDITALIMGHDWYGPVAHLIQDKPENLDFYIQALEIIIETMDYIISLPNNNDVVIYWSS